MMLTREQAAATWCPMVRVARHEVVRIEDAPVGNLIPVREAHHVVGGCNSASGTGCGPRNPASSRCIADQCAMWRWGTAIDPSYVPPPPPRGFSKFPSPPPPPAPRVRAEVGYCGLAGAPVIGGAS